MSTQRDARDAVAQRFQERAARAAGVTQSLFLVANTLSETELAADYGGERVSQAKLQSATDGGNLYAAVIGTGGEVLATSPGIPPNALQALRARPEHITRSIGGAQFALSNVLRDAVPGTTVVEYAASFRTDFGRRVLITGLPGPLIGALVGGLLARGPNAEGASTYVLDADGQVVGAPGSRPGTEVLPVAGLRSAFMEGDEGEFSSAGDEWYFASAPVPGTPWRVALSAPAERVFDSVSGSTVIVPWLLFAALALAAAAAFWLVARLLAADRKIESAYLALAESHAAVERKNAEVTERAEELARSNADLEEFASIASHDLQEPLRKVQAFGEQLELGFGDRLGEEGREHVARMRRAASRMSALIDDLLQFARIATEGAPFEPVPLGDVVEAAGADLELTLAEAGGELLVDELPTVIGDRRQLEQTFANLISNAVKYRRAGVPPVVKISAETSDGQAVVTVQDNGIGFEDAYRERIFGIFERLHSRDRYPGTGIGLAICRKILERHGGSITAHGIPDEGTTMVLTLPLAEAPATAERNGAGKIATLR
jgi:signal transduction histidine kinase